MLSMINLCNQLLVKQVSISEYILKTKQTQYDYHLQSYLVFTLALTILT